MQEYERPHAEKYLNQILQSNNSKNMPNNVHFVISKLIYNYQQKKTYIAEQLLK